MSDKDLQKERAARLRRQIRRVVEKEPCKDEPKRETPRDFVHRRMHEIEKKNP